MSIKQNQLENSRDLANIGMAKVFRNLFMTSWNPKIVAENTVPAEFHIEALILIKNFNKGGNRLAIAEIHKGTM